VAQDLGVDHDEQFGRVRGRLRVVRVIGWLSVFDDDQPLAEADPGRECWRTNGCWS
jgi:hypothetical protein